MQNQTQPHDTFRISVVVPLYNKEKYIRRSLESVAAQTFRNFDIVVIDDGSTDSGATIVREMQKELPHLSLVTQENQGVSAARNRGIQEAKGAWIAFLDADDVWSSTHLERLDELRRRFPEASLYGTAYRRTNLSGKGLSIILNDHRGRCSIVDRYFHYIRYAQFIYTSSIMIPRRVVDEIGGFPPGVKNGEDLDLWARAALHGPVAYAGFVTVDYLCGMEDQATGAHAARKGFNPYYTRQLHHVLTVRCDLPSPLRNDLKKHLKSYESRVCMKYACVRPVNRMGLFQYFSWDGKRATPLPFAFHCIQFFPICGFWRIIYLPKKAIRSRRLSFFYKNRTCTYISA